MIHTIDCEFHDTGSKIDLISIGIYREDGKSFSAASKDADYDTIKKDQWMYENVLAHLPSSFSSEWMTRTEIKAGIVKFIGADQNIEFWGDHPSYDWVAFCQLFGRMLDLPSNYPKYINCIRSYRQILGCNGEFQKAFGNSVKVHECMYDAKEIYDKYKWLKDYEAHKLISLSGGSSFGQ